ncbi:glycosyltransferase family 2 protein [Ramlibacter alkalitolerans]|uniref:Glycosyltransferase family 2 protein n=1 Tax=Ramlibacter alkalitolerans TaxID=2039631 RepID=A0ABS1JI02_9BURK|nr:glycosyltransferase family 2 protein [Ramlibacter alkalitolerans]
MTQQTSTPALSVVVPTYNAARYVQEALASVLAQDFDDFELLVVDDGSTDETARLLEPLAQDPRVRLLRNERNMGLIATLHRAYAQCRAPLIARMDADDVCEPTRFRRQVEFLRAHPLVGIVGGAIRFFGNIPQPNVFRFPQAHEGIRPAMLFYCPLAHPALMFRRELVDQGLFRYDDAFKHAEDYHLWSRLLLQVRAANLPDVVLDYRLHPQQVSSDSSARQYEASLRVRRQMLQEAGIDPTPEDVALHESVILERPLPRADYLAALADWLGRLEDANAGTAYWDAGELHQLLRGKFREAAQRVGADLGALAAAQASARYVAPGEAAAAAAPGATGLRARLKRRLKPLLWRLSMMRGR